MVGVLPRPGLPGKLRHRAVVDVAADRITPEIAARDDRRAGDGRARAMAGPPR